MEYHSRNADAATQELRVTVSSEKKRWLLQLSNKLLVFFFAIALMAGWSYFVCRDLRLVPQYLKGFGILTLTEHYYTCAAGETAELDVTFKNTSKQVVSIVGSQTDCGCVVSSGVPVRIQPGCDANIRVSVVPPVANPRAENRLLFFTSHSARSVCPVTLIGCVSVPTDGS